MSLLEIFLVGISLAMDAFAVSISNGISLKKLKFSQALLIAAFFGVFQAAMPIAGWFGGNIFQVLINSLAPWIAFVLLLCVGGKMIHEAFQKDDDCKEFKLKLKVLFILAIATSIDALAVGISLSCLNVHILFPAVMIGIITFIISLAGVYIGHIFGHIFEKKLEIFGGLVLIGIGFKIIIEHLMK